MNPAVTVAFCVAGRFPVRSILPYLASQVVGACAASVMLRYLFPTHAMLGATIPSGDALQSFVFEVLLTLILMFVVLRVSTGAKEKGITAGIAIGAVVGLEALFAGPVCGASMNPARSFAPAIVSGHLEYLWLYLVAPIVGALCAVAVARLIEEPIPNERENTT
jgi:aquaporin NIP